MGCFQSRRLQKEEAVIRSKARRRYMKQVVKSRQSLSFYHSLYLHSLRSTGSALLQFSNAESPPPATTTATTTNAHRDFPSPPPPPPPPMPPSPPLTPRWSPPPSAPPPQQQHQQQQTPPSWDFWDPFAPSSSHPPPPPADEDDRSEDAPTSTVSGSTLPPPPPPPPSSMDSSKSELAMVVAPRVAKDFSEIVRELDEYFLKAAQAGNRVSALLQVPDPRFDCHQPPATGRFGGGYGRSLSTLGGGGGGGGWSWRSNSRTRGFTRFGRFEEESRAAAVGHSSTVEKIYAWEKKLYVEVKTSEMLREEHEKRAKILRKLEVKGVDYVKIEKNKRKIERLESKMMVASQAMETTSSEITKLRESELFPQLLELINGLMCMWSSMYECHQVQTHIVQQLEYLTASPSSNPTSDVHRQASLQLEIEVDRWYSSFCNLVKSQRDYIYSLTGWLRLCLFQSYHLIEPLAKSQKPSSSNIYTLCEEWQLALDRLPDKVASEGIKSLLTVIHAIILQQGEEQKQKKRSESAFKELEKRVNELRSLEAKYGPYSNEGYGELSTRRMPVMEKKMKVDALKAKVEEEKAKYEKSSRVTRAMTINNLQTAFPNVFQAMTGFSSVCVQAFEAVYNRQRDSCRALESS